MTWFNNLSIKRKLILLIFGITLLAQIIAFSLLSLERHNYLKKELLAQSHIQARLIGEYCISPLVFEDVEGLNRILQKIEALPFILSAAVYDQKGDLVSFHQNADELETIPAHEIHDDIFTRKILHIREMISQDDIEYGQIHLRVSTAQLRKTLSKQLFMFALIVLGTIILIYCLANRFQRVISEPILKLAAFTDEISQTADFSLQIPKQSEDETGKLYDNFNNMIRQIKAKQEERNKANKALFDSEEKYRNLIKYTPLPLCIVENDGKIVFINDRFKKVFGYKLEDIPTLDEWWEKAYPDEKYRTWVLDTWNKAVDKARIEKTDIESVEYQVTCKNNQVRIIIISGITLKDGFLATLTDITERKLAQSALLESERKLREAQEMAQLGHWEWNITTGNVEWSDEVYKIFRLDPKTFSPKIDSILDFSPWPEDHERDKELIQKAIESHEKGSYEQRFLRPDKSIGFYSSTFQGRYDENDNLISIVGTVLDITERKLAEQELRKYHEHLEDLVKERTEELQSSNKELEAFAYSVSHDLRAPLRAIDGFTRILMQDYVDKLDEEAKRLGEVIQNNSQKMGQLIDDLLAFSRLGRATMHFSSICMKDIVNSVYLEETTPIERKRINFKVADLLKANGDPNMFRQVWINLISNAIKFSANQPQAVISITCQDDGKALIYSIEDNGAGFKMKYIDKLFGVFQRLHSAKEFPGTGVGLALVKRIINRHNGKVWAEGEVGKGATFYFSIPKNFKINGG